MILYKDFDSLFERFSIMTVDGNQEDKDILEYLKNKTTDKLYFQLISKVYKK